MENKTENKKEHSVTMLNRAKISMTGIEKVVNSSPTQLNVISSEGALTILGKELKIEQFSVSDGTLELTGSLDSVKYMAAKTPVLKRIFK